MTRLSIVWHLHPNPARIGSAHLQVAFRKTLCGLVATVLVSSLVARAASGPDAPRATTPNGKSTVTAADAQFWSFRPLLSGALPKVNDASWCRTPVDRFILAKLEQKNLRPNPPADRRALIRRAYFDLTGLPPSPEEAAAFVNDASPGAYSRLIDRLLASPHYGERWARHWLDIARFAESHGFEHDYDRPSAYHYRDFVIQALNHDLPYDQFVKWQIAGDELEPTNILALEATGFLAAGVHATQITANQAEKERYDELDDIVSTIGTSMLGMTIGCARCHDHKFDPIPTRNYYRMLSVFTTAVRTEIDWDFHPERYETAKAKYDSRHEPLVAAREQFEASPLAEHLKQWLATTPRLPKPQWTISSMTAGPLAMNLPPAQWDYSHMDILDSIEWKGARLDELPNVQRTRLLQWYRTQDDEWVNLAAAVRQCEAQEPHPELTKVLICSEGLPAVRLHTQGPDFYEKTYYLQRGNVNQKLSEAAPGFLQVLMRSGQTDDHWRVSAPDKSRTSFRRASLAGWITDTREGAGQLLARVIVNRLWQHHFGVGIVATPSDFGHQGDRPTHPELLDWLANQLVQNGWRLKPIQKLIMTSAVFMEDDQLARAANQADPDNSLCWRHTPARLDGEIIRDSILSISGLLDSTMFGPGTLDESMRRRSIYFTVKRSGLIPVLSLFDGPDCLQGLARRTTTTIAPQALFMMNNAQVRECARAFAARIMPRAKDSPTTAIRQAYRVAFGRLPERQELAESREFLRRQNEAYLNDRKADARELAWTDLCQALMSLNEFIYVD